MHFADLGVGYKRRRYLGHDSWFHLYQMEDVELIPNLDSSAGKCNARIEPNCPMTFRGSMVDHK